MYLNASSSKHLVGALFRDPRAFDCCRTKSPANSVSQGWHTEYLLPKSPQEHT
jgi:hypothetical protein